MRRLIAQLDQMPGWQFVLAAAIALAGIKAWWMAGHLARNPGVVELGGLLLLAGSIVLSIFAIRRRQTGVWDAAAQIIFALAGANLLSYFVLIPFLPPGSTGEIARLLREGIGETLIGIGLAIPAQAGGLWLSRRFGTHSAVTERRATLDGPRVGIAVADSREDVVPVAEAATPTPAIIPIPAPVIAGAPVQPIIATPLQAPTGLDTPPTR